MFELMDAELFERITEAAGRMAETAEEGDPAAAVATFLEILGLPNE